MTMNGGEGIHSYSKNSAFQVVGQIKGVIEEMVVKNLNVDEVSARRIFRVADMGSSSGPNTFFAVEMIIEAVQKKYLAQGLADRILPEFHVFFSDRPENDFNTLFRTLPSEKKYYAAGVPGSFYGRLFPDDFIDFVYSSYALHWLSEVPKNVLDRGSPAFNKDKIHYATASKEVIDAFETQFHTDMSKFLDARAREVRAGGMMALVVRVRPDGTPHHRLLDNKFLDILGSCLVDMAEEGTIAEAKVDEFNVPIYFGTSRDIESVVIQNGCFEIDKIDPVIHGEPFVVSPSMIQMASGCCRALLEGLLVEHFGEGSTEEIFRRWSKKVEELEEVEMAIGVVVLLKRNHKQL